MTLTVCNPFDIMCIRLFSSKYSLWLFAILLPFYPIDAALNPASIINQAERLLAEKLYGDALPLYSLLLTPPLEQEKLKDPLTLRLATCYLQEKQPQMALSLLRPLQGDLYRHHALYLMSLAYRQLGEPTQALSLLQQISPTQEMGQMAALEKGSHLFFLGDFTHAQLVLEKILWQEGDPLPYYLAQLSLMKIHLITRSFDAAHTTLHLLNNHLPEDHPLNIEKIYLHGWLLLMEQQEAQAAACFERLLPKALSSKAKWVDQLFCSLATSYLRQALAYAYQPDQHHAEQAWKALHQLLTTPQLLSTFEYPQAIDFLAGWVALHLTHQHLLKQASVFLQKGQMDHPAPMWRELCLKLEGLIYLQLREWDQADSCFVRLLEDHPGSPRGDVWFWRAYCADQQNQPAMKKEYLQRVYTEEPQSPYAPMAYFHLYTHREYLRGQRKAIKHLQNMPLTFPSHPLLISAYYLMGLDHKKDHFSEDEKLVRRKDWTAAIEAFHQAELTFNQLLEKEGIPLADLPYFIQVRYRAQLERAQVTLAIAKCSSGGKRHIYLEYAEGVFKQLIQDLTTPHPRIKSPLKNQPFYSNIWIEAELRLAQTYEEKERWEEAERSLDRFLAQCQQSHLTQGYWLMRIWYEKGRLARQRQDPSAALRCFFEAEQAVQDYSGLSPDEKLDLWIQQSLCYQALNRFEEAMRLLSRVINDHVISALRIKAMYLRAEIYELQGRHELALKQLEAAASKGGEWAQKAQEKLAIIYGY